jgi:type I restriction enzyme M protein
MLIATLAEVKRAGGEHRTLRLYGQERNHMTAAIARMNLVLHGVEDYAIQRGDTLAQPRFTQADRLCTFDVVLANPPYSIKQWDRGAWQTDPWGRNVLGTPPQGRADYAFFQHILKSLDPETGRCAVLFPHGILFRNEESAMRRRLIEADLLDCVLGLGPNLFFNSPMEACVVVCRSRKPPERRGHILFIDAVGEVTRERAYSYLTADHQQRIAAAYDAFVDEPGFAAVAPLARVSENGYSLSIPLYVRRTPAAAAGAPGRGLAEVWADWERDGAAFWGQMDRLVETLDGLTAETARPGAGAKHD